jgi:tetratricopeptide (TPR) repeat protein
MNNQLVIRICVLLLICIAGYLIWQRIMKLSDGMKLVSMISIGGVGGLLAVKYLLPWIGDAFGEAMFSSGEKIEQDDMMKAAACISQGNYEGAIGHYEKMLEEKPEDPFPVAEIAKLQAERLHDPQAALNTLSGHLQSRDWPVDDAAFLMFRIAEVNMSQLHDYGQARDMLEQVIGNFPGTRHSANAYHKISEIEQLEFKHIQDQKARAAAAVSSQSAENA